MGSSFIGFKDQGFEASDGSMEILLALIVGEIDKLNPVPEWLREVRNDWAVQSTAGFGFGIAPDLDRYLTDAGKRNTVLGLARQAITYLEGYGAVVPREKLNALETGGAGSTFPEDVPAEILLRPARYFVKLLEGELTPNEADARFEPGIGR
jgi:hypothetical protein